MAKGRKTHPNGRNAGEQYVNVGYPFLNSPAWRSLGGAAMKVWWELRTRFDGSNNGKILLSFEDAKRTLNLGKATVKRAFDELQAKGFVRLIKKGHWFGRQANEWAITNLPYQGYLPTNDWKRYVQPAKKTKAGSGAERGAPEYVPMQIRDMNLCSVLEPVADVSVSQNVPFENH